MAILSTVAVREYWASWAVMLMITSGEAIEEYAQAKAEHSLTALMQAAPQTAHVVNLPGVGCGDAADEDDSSDGFRRVGSVPATSSPQSTSPTAPLGERNQVPPSRGADSRSETEGSMSSAENIPQSAPLTAPLERGEPKYGRKEIL